MARIKYEISTVEFLKRAKTFYTFRQLARMIELPEYQLCTYVNERRQPSMRTCQHINQVLQKAIRIEGDIQARISFDEYGYFDNSRLIYDLSVLEKLAHNALTIYHEKRINTVLTAADDGIPLATCIASLLGTQIVVARKDRRAGVNYLEEIYQSFGSGVISLYVPKDLIKKHSAVLIVDDVIDSGEPQFTMAKIVQRCKAQLVGIYGIVSIGNAWKEKLGQLSCKTEIVLEIAGNTQR